MPLVDGTLTVFNQETQRYVKLRTKDNGDGTQSLQMAATPTSTATCTSVAASTLSVSLLPANAGRKGLILYNDSSSTLYVAYAATATTTAFTAPIPADGLWEMPAPIYTGVLSGLWLSASGAARLTELTS